MKHFYIVVISLCLVTGAMAQWIPQNSNTTHILRSVYFIDENTGYAVGDSGTILKTTNGGTDWVLQNSGITSDLYSVHFPEPSTGYIVTIDGKILSSNNGGSSWTIQYSADSSSLKSVFFTNADTGYAAGSKYSPIYTGFILRTTNGGIQWSEIYIDSIVNYHLNSIFFPDANNGFAVGTQIYPDGSYRGNILRTQDNGNNWTRQDVNNTHIKLYSVYFINKDTGYVAGQGFGASILKTNDGGINWTSQYSTFLHFTSVFFNDALTGFVVGQDGRILKTDDGGNSWPFLVSGITYILYSVHFPSTNIGYIVGENGTILKTINGGVGINDLLHTANPLTIYPNPVTDKITLETSSIGILSILNPCGQQLLQQRITEPKTTININTLPNGVYMIKLISENMVHVGKIVKN